MISVMNYEALFDCLSINVFTPVNVTNFILNIPNMLITI